MLKLANIIEAINMNFPMPLKVRMVIMSHLSDVQELAGTSEKEIIRRVNFVKFLMLKYSDTNIEIDEDKEWEEFIKKYPQHAC